MAKFNLSQLVGAALGIAVAFGAAIASPTAATAEESRLQLGTLVCNGQGGWGLIITSKKSFDCTFARADGGVRGRYTGVIRKVGLDLGVTGDTTLVWLVFGPESKVGDNYTPGSLAGNYGGVGAEVNLGAGMGVNAMIGGGGNSFALQPVSIQAQTGLSIAAAVQSLQLDYVGPIK